MMSGLAGEMEGMMTEMEGMMTEMEGMIVFVLKSPKFTLKLKQCYLTQNARSSSIHRCLKSSNSQEYL